jgi:hypothetical protein
MCIYYNHAYIVGVNDKTKRLNTAPQDVRGSWDKERCTSVPFNEKNFPSVTLPYRSDDSNYYVTTQGTGIYVYVYVYNSKYIYIYICLYFQNDLKTF